MGKINVLSFEIANLIAAGEVVERPASVLKELIENSIDAGAKNIVAEIKNGGVSLIRVTDDGHGISRDDLPVSLKRHATSKISDTKDLNSIMTLGFRGEALAAISSVSNITIISKTKGEQTASMLTADAGEITDISEVYASDGTTVVVKNLFYNVPARRKFLKKDSTEALNVLAVLEKVALSRPDISIQLLIDGEEKFHTSGSGELIDTVYAIFGKSFSEKLIKVSGSANGIKVNGYIGRSDNVKRNRNYMNTFINGRYVKSVTVSTATEKAFTSYIAPECFPVSILFIEMHPSIVDVNVHPAKLEVKFSDERAVFEAVYHTVRSAVEKEEYRPELTLSKQSKKNYSGAFLPIGENGKREQISLNPTPYIKENNFKNQQNSYKNEYNPTRKYEDDKPMSFRNSIYEYSQTPEKNQLSPSDSVEILKKYKQANPSSDILAHREASATEAEELTATENEVEYRFIGEAYDCYLFVEYMGDILVIDKHAAHERVIFEQLKAQRQSDGRIASQVLLLPLLVTLTAEEISVASTYKEEFLKVGFDFELNGSVLDLKAIPAAISAFEAEGLIIQMLDEIMGGEGTPEYTENIRREKALYQIACKAAIKGGRKYDESVHRWLITKLLSLPDITVCPHGRPVAFKLTKNELDRHFDRIK